jgi:hypothetical protein
MPHTTTLSNDGWAGAMQTLLATCPPAKAPAPTAQAARAGEGAVK